VSLRTVTQIDASHSGELNAAKEANARLIEENSMIKG
jgi:hypothetical protein